MTQCPECGAPLPRANAPWCRVCGEILDGGDRPVDDGDET